MSDYTLQRPSESSRRPWRLLRRMGFRLIHRSSLERTQMARPWSCSRLAVAMLLLWSITRAYPMLATGASGARFQLRASAFRAGGTIPSRYTCSGSNVSPALSWTPPPSGAKSLALIVTDPDAPGHTWVHWVVFNLPPTAHELPTGVPKQAEIASGGQQGSNDSGSLGYDGPCPPPGSPHRYFFRLYALNTRLNLKSGATRAQVEQAIKGHVLAEAELKGLFHR